MAEEKQEITSETEPESWDPKAEADNEMHLERGDRFAMLVAGCLTVALPITLLIVLICVVTILLFTR
jgi:hypothetical protein